MQIVCLKILDDLDWPESLKDMQRNWIGRSEGAQLTFEIEGTDLSFEAFTTRPDTIFGATYAVLAPEHKLVKQITTDEQQEAVANYLNEVKLKSDLERTDLADEKTGVFTGAYAINPASGEKMPIWIADYVLASYGTGAIMAVPAHDERDYEFAEKFDLPIVEVVAGGDISKEAYVGDGKHINSGFLRWTWNKMKRLKKQLHGLSSKEKVKRKFHIVYVIGYFQDNVIGESQFQLFIGKTAR